MNVVKFTEGRLIVNSCLKACESAINEECVLILFLNWDCLRDNEVGLYAKQLWLLCGILTGAS